MPLRYEEPEKHKRHGQPHKKEADPAEERIAALARQDAGLMLKSKRPFFELDETARKFVVLHNFKQTQKLYRLPNSDQESYSRVFLEEAKKLGNPEKK